MSKQLQAFKRGDTSLDKIRAYYADPLKYPLSETLEAVRERLQHVMQLRLNYWNKQKIITYLKDHYGIEQAQAYNDIRNSELLFGEINETSRKAKQALLYEFSLQFLQRARERNDMKAEAKALDLLGKYSGVNDEENPEFNSDKWDAYIPKLNVPKKALDLFMKMAMEGNLNMNNFSVRDIPYEEVKEEPSETKESEENDNR